MRESERSDQELMRLMIAGQEEAFVELYHRKQSGVFRFAMNMSGSRAIAEDVTQEVFMALMKNGNAYNPDRGPLVGYLYGIARNCVLRHIERDRRYVPISPETDETGPASEAMIAAGDPLGDLTKAEEVDAVRQAVLALPSHYREVVVLCDLHDMSYVEAAQAIGCAVGTVRSRLSRARGLLISKLRSMRNSETPLSSGARCLV